MGVNGHLMGQSHSSAPDQLKPFIDFVVNVSFCQNPLFAAQKAIISDARSPVDLGRGELGCVDKED